LEHRKIRRNVKKMIWIIFGFLFSILCGIYLFLYIKREQDKKLKEAYIKGYKDGQTSKT